MDAPVTRRNLLLAGAASVLPLSSEASARTKAALRVIHFTDFHIQPELGAARGSVMAMRHAMSQHPEPDLVLVGGDMVMDSWSADEPRTALQWDLYERTLAANVKVPVHHAIGNHDIWGIDKAKSHTTGQEARWGKNWFRQQFGYENTYHSFDFGGWHFVMLDNVLLTPDGYNGFIDPEQLEWLEQDLSASDKPTLIVSHIPLLSVTGLAMGYDDKSGEWNVGGDIMTKNVDRLRELFRKNRRVKLCVSGHVHMVDRVDYEGVSYLCGGAVCGNWWKGARFGFEPGYRMLDLHEDGRFEEQYVAWGWHENL
jgi:3',5'-cyclic AMP phosphodiesterase CpdA